MIADHAVGFKEARWRAQSQHNMLIRDQQYCSTNSGHQDEKRRLLAAFGPRPKPQLPIASAVSSLRLNLTFLRVVAQPEDSLVDVGVTQSVESQRLLRGKVDQLLKRHKVRAHGV